MTPEEREANIPTALKAKYEAAKTRIEQDYKRRGMASEDIAKHNAAVLRVYAEAGLPVTTCDLAQDFCAQALAKLGDFFLWQATKTEQNL